MKFFLEDIPIVCSADNAILFFDVNIISSDVVLNTKRPEFNMICGLENSLCRVGGFLKAL